MNESIHLYIGVTEWVPLMAGNKPILWRNTSSGEYRTHLIMMKRLAERQASYREEVVDVPALSA